MTEEEELLAEIGALAGRQSSRNCLPSTDDNIVAGQINRRKNQDAPQQASNHLFVATSASRTRPGYFDALQSGTNGPGRGQIFQNRSLPLDKPGSLDPTFTPPAPEQPEVSSDENSKPTRRGVAKYGIGAKAWISEDALRRKLERRKHFANSVQTASTGHATQQAMSSSSGTSSPAAAYIRIDDIPFQVINGGSKLLRISGAPRSPSSSHRLRSDLYRYLKC